MTDPNQKMIVFDPQFEEISDQFVLFELPEELNEKLELG
jgi:hypothetical protein